MVTLTKLGREVPLDFHPERRSNHELAEKWEMLGFYDRRDRSAFVRFLARFDLFLNSQVMK